MTSKAKQTRPRDDFIADRLWQLGQRLAAALPLSVSYPCAVVAANVAWLLLPAKRRNAIENMAQVLGGGCSPRARRTARRSFENYARYVVDFVRQPALDAAYLLKRVEVEYWPQLDEVLARGRGCILVLTHFGNWDFGAAAIALTGYPFNAIGETQGSVRLNRAIVSARTARGVKLIPMERAATGIVRAMRRNEVLAILIDRPLREGGAEVEFFGAPTRVPEGPARIALRTGAKLVPVSLLRVRQSDDRIRAIADFSIDNPSSGNVEADVRALTQALIASHERVIRRYPEQWYMFRRMWPHDPCGAVPHP